MLLVVLAGSTDDGDHADTLSSLLSIDVRRSLAERALGGGGGHDGHDGHHAGFGSGGNGGNSGGGGGGNGGAHSAGFGNGVTLLSALLYGLYAARARAQESCSLIVQPLQRGTLFMTRVAP